MASVSKRVTNQVSAAIGIAVLLIDAFNAGAGADPMLTALQFARLRKRIRSLRQTCGFRRRFVTNMADWPRMWEAGDYRAARYQIVQLIRKLRKYRKARRTGSVRSAILAPPSEPCGERG